MGKAITNHDSDNPQLSSEVTVSILSRVMTPGAKCCLHMRVHVCVSVYIHVLTSSESRGFNPWLHFRPPMPRLDPYENMGRHWSILKLGNAAIRFAL